MALTLTEAQRLLLGIIASVKSGVTEPTAAALELNELKDRTKMAGLNFQADYTVEDFEAIKDEAFFSEYEYESDYEYEDGEEEEN